MSSADLKRCVFNAFLKSVLSETVHESAGSEFHAARLEKLGISAVVCQFISLTHENDPTAAVIPSSSCVMLQ